MLTYGTKEHKQAIVIHPLFEEMNFTRSFIADIARALDGHGVSSWLPDLPGTGESLIDLADLGWDDWRDAARAAGEAIAAYTGCRPHVVALRGGSLLSDAVNGQSWWSFAPESGASLLRHLQRTQLVSCRNNVRQKADNNDYFEYAGYTLSSAMQSGLSVAEASRHDLHRIVPAEANGMVWRRAEPGRDTSLSEALAADIAGWIAACEPR
jgi:hypothetical protein